MSKTLLLADDSVTIQRVVELTFVHEDVRVVSVNDGRRAVQFLDGKAHLPLVAAPLPVEAQLEDLAGALRAAHTADRFEGRDRPHCDAIGCGYRWLCW